jgi:hypothetical protein
MADFSIRFMNMPFKRGAKVAMAVFTACLVLAGIGSAATAEAPKTEAPNAEAPKPTVRITPPYSVADALKSIISPHEQINDEGEILWEKCLICHKNIPDIKAEKSIKDVTLRYDGNMNDICYKCHPIGKHPGSEDITSQILQSEAPEHLVVPSKLVVKSMRFLMKDVQVILPLEPKTGKVICSTCHNPHERGVLYGRANWGADTRQRLRSEGLDICQFCHKK